MAVLTASGGQVMPGARRLWTDFQGNILTAKSVGAGAATGSAGDVNALLVGGYGDVPAAAFEWCVKGTQTIVAPTKVAGGLDIASQDQTADDGIEITPGILYRANSPASFKVGTDGPFYVKVKFSIADVSGTDDMAIGFRKAEAYQANIDDYADMAVLNVISGDIKTETILGGAATTTTDTTDNWADGAEHTLGVYVDAAGKVTYTIDGAAPTAVAASAFSFADGAELVPFIFMLENTDIAGVICVSEFDCGLQ